MTCSENKIPPKKRPFFWWSFGKNFGTFMNLLIRVDSQMIIKYKTKKNTPEKRWYNVMNLNVRFYILKTTSYSMSLILIHAQI